MSIEETIKRQKESSQALKIIGAMTDAQRERIQREYSHIAGEPVEVCILGGCLYAFGSELGTLRLFRKMPSKTQGFSENLKRHFFSLNIDRYIGPWMK